MKDQEYNRALGLLNTIPETYEDVFDLKMDCLYLPGVAALEKGEYDTAVQYLSQVSTYKDGADKLPSVPAIPENGVTQEEPPTTEK